MTTLAPSLLRDLHDVERDIRERERHADAYLRATVRQIREELGTDSEFSLQCAACTLEILARSATGRRRELLQLGAATLGLYAGKAPLCPCLRLVVERALWEVETR